MSGEPIVAIPVVVDLLLRQEELGGIILNSAAVAIPVVVDLLLRHLLVPGG